MVGGYQPLKGESNPLYCTEFGSKSSYVVLPRSELFQAQRSPAHVTILAQDRWNTTQFTGVAIKRQARQSWQCLFGLLYIATKGKRVGQKT